MEINKLISAILREPWFLQEDYALSQLTTILNVLEGSPVAFEKDDERKPADQTIVSVESENVTLYTKSRSWQSFSDAPKGSIARLDISNVLLKHDNCGDPGMMRMAQFIQEADQNPNIIASYLDIDSPGGMVYGTETLMNAVKNHKKPIYAHVREGIAASAGYKIFAAADKSYVSNETDEVGSIGTMTNFHNFTKFYESKGIDIQQIYATLSTNKNGRYRAALAGDFQPMTEMLDQFNNLFIESVKQNRNISAPSTDERFSGKMYSAAEAEKLNLIDGVRTQSEVIKELIAASKNQQVEYYV